MEMPLFWGIAGIVLAIPLLTVWLVTRTLADRRRIVALEARVVDLETRGPMASATPAADEELRPKATRGEPAAAHDRYWSYHDDVARETPADTGPAADRHAITGSPTAPARTGSFEQRLASHWMVWMGAVAVAMGGVFLVRHAMTHGWLEPAARVALGVVIGLLLTAAGEVLRRIGAKGRATEENGRTARRSVDAVPTALAGAGLFVAGAAIWAGHALYGLVPGVVAFAALGVFSFAAFGLSLLHGVALAYLGLLGGFLTPALVSGEPSTLALFGWLAVISAACVALARFSGWTLIAHAALAGCTAWTLAWLAGPFTAGDATIIGPWILLVSAGFVHGLTGGVPAPSHGARLLVWEAAAAGTFLTFVLVPATDHGTAALATLFVLSAWLLVLGRLGAPRDGTTTWGLVWPIDMISRPLLPVAAAGATVAAFLLWPVSARIYLHPTPYGTGFIPAAIAFGLLFGLAGFAALWGAAGHQRPNDTPQRRLAGLSLPAVWAGLSAVVPLALWTIGWWWTSFGDAPRWTPSALGLAAVALAAASVCARWRGNRATDDALAVYGAAAAAFIALAAATVLDNAWLTAAIALEIPAIAWVESRVGSRVLRPVALALAGTVAARLLLNWNLFSYPLGETPWLSWVLWGYGLPAACFGLAARTFRRLDGGGSRLTAVLETGAVVFAVLFVTLEIRLAVEGTLRSFGWSLLERSLQTLAWLAAAATLLGRPESPGRLLEWTGRVLASGAFGQLVLGNLVFGNPAVTGAYLGTWPIVDLLLPAFLVPAVLCGLLVHAFARRQRRTAAGAFAGLALVLAFAWVTLEVSRLFQGPVLDFGRGIADAEAYAWSAAWIAFAAALFAAGARLARLPAAARRLLLRASLAVMAIVTCKVFLFDMAGLDGLWRVASFFGLGLSLIGIGWAWRRFVPSTEN